MQPLKSNTFRAFWPGYPITKKVISKVTNTWRLYSAGATAPQRTLPDDLHVLAARLQATTLLRALHSLLQAYGFIKVRLQTRRKRSFMHANVRECMLLFYVCMMACRSSKRTTQYFLHVPTTSKGKRSRKRTTQYFCMCQLHHRKTVPQTNHSTANACPSIPASKWCPTCPRPSRKCN